MQEHNHKKTESKADKNRRLSLILGSVVICMFLFAFAMSPLYQLYCAVTGINNIASNSGRISDKQVLTGEVDEKRTVMVQFDVTLNQQIPFTVRPKHNRIEVHPGEAVTTSYVVKNTSPENIVTQAVPGVTPWQATAYFHKTECFCFTQQTLEGNEEVEMGLVFMVDTDLPEDIEVLTLSYTFMDTQHLNTVTRVNE